MIFDDCFGDEARAWLFAIQDGTTDVLRNREARTVEYKENLNLSEDAKAKLAKSMAAFANGDGGYIVYGITNQPHRIVGMTNDNLTKFDPRTLTQFLNNHFSPSIRWEHVSLEREGKRIGLVYVSPATLRPIVCTRNVAGVLRDGDVFYRYEGESRLAASAELHSLIEERVLRERRSWQDLLGRVAQVEPSAAYLLDATTGRADGENHAVFISPESLKDLHLIHEGSFEEGGEPTLKIVGSVEVARPEIVMGKGASVAVDPSGRCPYWEKEAFEKLRALIGKEVPWGEETKALTNYDFRCVVEAHSIESPSPMHFVPKKSGSRRQYGELLITWIAEEFERDPAIFYRCVKWCKPSKDKRESCFPTPQDGKRDTSDYESANQGTLFA